MLKSRIFEKKGNLSSEEENLAFLFRIIEHDSCQVTSYKCSQGLLRAIVQVMRLFLWDLMVVRKQTFQKISISTETKVFARFSLVSSRMTNLREQFKRVHEVFFQLVWKLKDPFFRTYEVLENTNLWKKAIFAVKKKHFRLFFLVYWVLKNWKNNF